MKNQCTYIYQLNWNLSFVILIFVFIFEKPLLQTYFNSATNFQFNNKTYMTFIWNSSTDKKSRFLDNVRNYYQIRFRRTKRIRFRYSIEWRWLKRWTFIEMKEDISDNMYHYIYIQSSDFAYRELFCRK